MKKFYLPLLLASLFISSEICSQSFSDNFDTYTAGNYLCVSNAAWKTWNNTTGGTTDIKISNAKAKSGANSLYFLAVGGGGPSDIVLPFGGQYNTGTMSLSLSLFVENGKAGYFNLQEQSVNGKAWTIDVDFDSAGKFMILNTQSGVLLTGTYTQNSWIKVDLQINLNKNEWNFLIDGASKGTFQNTYRQIASMDIYAKESCAFYVDDVNYTYTSYTLPPLNAALTYISNVTGFVATQATLPIVEVRNLGSQIINSLSIEIDYNGIKQTKNVSGLSLASLATTSITLDNPIVIAPGASTVTATVKLVNGVADGDNTDNIKTLSFTSPVHAPGKVVIAEESTGTWCQWCPRGAVWLKKMDDRFDNLIIGIAVHNNDPMMFGPYDKGLGLISSGYPSMVVDRGPDIDPSGMEAPFFDRIGIAPKATIREGAKYNSTTRVLDISLTTKFVQGVTGDYRIALVITEDSVTGTTTKYNQSNAYAGGAAGDMGGYEILPNPVPANKMVYNHVGRIISPTFNGLPNAFKPTVNVGDSFTHNFSVYLDPYWKSNKIHIIGMLIDPTGKIDNGSKASIDEAIQHGFVNGTFVTGITKQTFEGGEIIVYPNPSSDKFNLILPENLKGATEISIYDMQGKLVETIALPGNTAVEINSQNWAPGFYFGAINANGVSAKIKLIKE